MGFDVDQKQGRMHVVASRCYPATPAGHHALGGVDRRKIVPPRPCLTRLACLSLALSLRVRVSGETSQLEGQLTYIHSTQLACKASVLGTAASMFSAKEL